MYRHIENTNEEIRKEIKHILKELYNYRDDNNPFGDNELSKPFIWLKKIESLKEQGFNPPIYGEDIPDKIKKAKVKLDKIKEKIRTEEIKKEEN